MINLFDYINEGILASVEDAIEQGNNIIDNNTIQQWCVSDKCRIVKKKNGYKLYGNFKMTWDKEHYDGPKILDVDGNFSISNSKLTSLEGLFTMTASEVTGTFTIENNHNLVSLKGCPLQVGTLTITGNTNLKDIDIAPMVMRNAYISKNGKRFNKEQLSGKINVYKNIFCAFDDEETPINESLVCESFKAPQLKLIADAIKKVSNGVSKSSRLTFLDIMTIEWDKIEASQVTELDTDDPKCMKLARAYISNKIKGIMAYMDKNGEVIGVVKNKRIYKINEKYRTYRWGNDKRLDKWNSSDDVTTTDILDTLSQYDSVLFIEIDLLTGYNNWSRIRAERNSAQYGAIALMKGRERTGDETCSSERIDKEHVRYYQSIANENKERYKKLLTEIKAKKALLSNNFIQIKDRLDKAFARYTALLEKILKNPAKYDSYDITWLNDTFNNVSSNKYGYKEIGLFVQIEQYMKYVIDASKGNVYNNSNIDSNIKHLETSIIEKLQRVENELTKLESK